MGVKTKSRSKEGSQPQGVPSTALENIPLTESGEPLFFIDLRPTKINQASIPVQGKAASLPSHPAIPQKPPQTQKAQPPGAEPGMNRDARRRLAAIEKYRQEAKRSLRIPADSAETTKELENRVAAWTRSYDVKRLREANKKHARRKSKEEAASARQSKEMRKRSRR